MASYLQARAANGLWHIRIDDIDPPREVKGATDLILDSLNFHGFKSDQPVAYQSLHTRRYETALDKLLAKGRIYACNCTRKSIREYTDIEGLSDGNNIYPSLCRLKGLSHNKNVIRFVVDGKVCFNDGIQGQQEQNLDSEVGDFVLRRREGLFSYQLANVVDDGVDGITEVVRGADLLDNTPRQIQLAQALGFKLPAYLHVPVAMNKDGQKLAKQTHARPLSNALALENLLQAWQFLGQEKLNLQGNRIPEFWDKALSHWSVDRIPAEQSLYCEYFEK